MCNFNLSCEQVKDINALEDPFNNLRVGQTVTARVIAKAKQSDKKNYQWDLSLKPKVLAAKQYLIIILLVICFKPLSVTLRFSYFMFSFFFF